MPGTLFSPSLAPWLVLAAALIYGLAHSLLASLTAKKWAVQQFGASADRYYRLVFNFIATLTLLPLLALPALLPDRLLYAIPFPWTILTLAIQGLSILVLVAGVIHTGLGSFLGTSQALGTPENQAGQLVVGGLYSSVRHPLYAAGLAFIWFVPRMTANFLAFSLGITLYILLGATFEERKLLSQFGEPYQRYQKRTPMLVPWKKPEV